MVIEATGVAAVVLVVAVAVGLIRHWRSHGRRAVELEVVRPQPTGWRLLETDAELREALERALRTERGSAAQAQQRADRLAALRSRLVSAVAGGAGEQATTRVS